MKKVYWLSAINIALITAIFIVKGNIHILDVRMFYSPADADLFFLTLTEGEKSSYLIVNAIDFIFMSFYTLWFIEVYKICFEKEGYYKHLIFIPLCLCLVDSVETSILMYFNLSYPNVADVWKWVLVVATPLKWFFALSSFLVIVNGYLLKLYLDYTKN
jgi:hypothetical protein